MKTPFRTACEATRINRRARGIPAATAVAAAALAITLSALAVEPPLARASRDQVAILQDDLNLFAKPSTTFQEMRHLGVSMVRVLVRWSSYAPNPTSHTKPQFDATDPGAYPAGTWNALDTVVLDAQAAGIQVMFDPTGFAPLWAQGPDPRRYGAKYDVRYAWEPNAPEFGQFVQALATRYSGSFVPPGSSTPLPHVGVWEIWNEPNFGEDLAPQALDGSQLMASPRIYRTLADAAWSALQATGHSQDTIIIGSLLPDGFHHRPTKAWRQGLPGTYGGMKPLVFVRELYCLDPSYHRYVGRAAASRGCPTTTAGYENFRAQNPVLFDAGGFSDHPYNLAKRKVPPNSSGPRSAGWAELSQIPHLASVLDHIQRLYGSNNRFPIWNTEFGYVTCPPNCVWHIVSPATAAFYINWAEYLSWRDPQIVSTMQYLIFDPNPAVGVDEYGGFASGLAFYQGAPKPEYYAYRMPIFLPFTRTRTGRPLEVWADVRPAPYAVLDGDGPQQASIQFERSGSRAWTTLKTLLVTDPHGYLDTWMTFPSSGSVRISWTYPPGDKALQSSMVTNSNGTIYSRTVSLTITSSPVTRDRRR